MMPLAVFLSLFVMPCMYLSHQASKGGDDGGSRRRLRQSREHRLPNRRHEGAFMTQVLHRLRMDVAQLANGRVRPAPFCQVVTRPNLLMRHHPSKEFAFGLRVCGPDLRCLKGGVATAELAAVCGGCGVYSRGSPAPPNCIGSWLEFYVQKDGP